MIKKAILHIDYHKQAVSILCSCFNVVKKKFLESVCKHKEHALDLEHEGKKKEVQ